MIYLSIFGALLMLFSVWVVSLTVPFLPAFPIVWSAVAFLLFAELLFLVMVGMMIAHRSIKGTPVTMSFLAFPALYVLCSCAIVPCAALFLTFTPLLLCHFSLLLLLMGIGFAMLGTADKNKAETQHRAVKRAEIRRTAAALSRCVSELQRKGKGCASEELCLVAERLQYAPESNDSADCMACDSEVESLIGELEKCVASYDTDRESKAAEVSALTAKLKAAVESRRLTLTK